MFYLIQNNAEELFSSFGLAWVVAQNGTKNDIDGDLCRTYFLGTPDQEKEHVSQWSSTTEQQTQYYSQGNMSAGNLFLLLNPENPVAPFKKPDETDEHYTQQKVNLAFAYVNERNELCGLNLFYRKDDPSQWMIGLSCNNQMQPKERQLTLLTSSELKSANTNSNLNGRQVTSFEDPFISEIGNSFLQTYIQCAIDLERGEIDPRSERIELLLRNVKNENRNQAESESINFQRMKPAFLFDPALDVLVQHQMVLSETMIEDCLSDESGLRKEIQALKLTQDTTIDKNMLQMTVAFYEAGILDKHRAFLQKELFSKVSGEFTWSEAQINLIPLMIERKYDLDLFHLILANEEYTLVYSFLKERGLTQNAPKFFYDAAKLEQLKYIHQLELKNQQELCWVFWAKTKFSLDQLKELIDATNKYPLLADMLLARDKSQTLSIENLNLLARNPKQHVPDSIVHHFQNEFHDMSLNQDALKKLDKNELEPLTACFEVLRNSKIKSAEYYKKALQNEKRGKIIRLLLPGLQSIETVTNRKALIEVLYTGIKKGIASQGLLVKEIKDKTQRQMAEKLHDRFICATHLQDLDSEEEILTFSAKENDIKADSFRQIILRVQKECSGVQERLGSSAANGTMKEWQAVEKEYRKTLYCIAYQAFHRPGQDIKSLIQQAEQKVLNTVDPESHSIVKKALILIANLLITLLSLGLANVIKYKQTGNLWFFNQSESGEKIRAVNKEVIELLEVPAQDVPAFT